MALRLNDVALCLSPPLAARRRRSRSRSSGRFVAVASMTSAVSTK
jgi:acyl-[acyl-carrier-protein] desaturase